MELLVRQDIEPLSGPRVPRAWLSGGVRGPDPQQHGRESALHGGSVALLARAGSVIAQEQGRWVLTQSVPR